MLSSGLGFSRKTWKSGRRSTCATWLAETSFKIIKHTAGPPRCREMESGETYGSVETSQDCSHESRGIIMPDDGTVTDGPRQSRDVVSSRNQYGNDDGQDSREKKRKRGKYTARACLPCQQRKTKVSYVSGLHGDRLPAYVGTIETIHS